MIKQNKETGSNSRAEGKKKGGKKKKPSSVWFAFSWLFLCLIRPLLLLPLEEQRRQMSEGLLLRKLHPPGYAERERGRVRKRRREGGRASYCQDSRVSARPVGAFKIAEMDFSRGTRPDRGQKMRETPGRQPLLLSQWTSACSLWLCRPFWVRQVKRSHRGVGRGGAGGNTRFVRFPPSKNHQRSRVRQEKSGGRARRCSHTC